MPSPPISLRGYTALTPRESTTRELRREISRESTGNGHVNATDINSFDDIVEGGLHGALNDMFDLRDTSMDIHNDPRFFKNSVIEKRLGAFKSLTIVNTLQFGTALKFLNETPKDFDFRKSDPLAGNIGVWEVVAFLLCIVVSFMSMLPLYVLVHQIFYTTRLETIGPAGFEHASQFYLTRTIVLWRHLALSCMFNGLWVFLALVGIQYFLLFWDGANKEVWSPHQLYVTNMVNGSTANATVQFPGHHKLDMTIHSFIAYGGAAAFFIILIVLYRVRLDHVNCFKLHYAQANLKSAPLEKALNEMSQRADRDVPVP